MRWYQGRFTSMPVETSEQAKALIQGWMENRGLYKDDTISAKNVIFQLNGVNSLGIAFTIIQPESLKTSIIILAQIDLHPEHYKALADLNKSARNKFLFGLKRDLVFRPPAFTFNDPEIPKSIQFSNEIMFEELSEPKIRDVIENAIKCVLWVAWSFSEKFGTPKGA
jgi:hypothetical protein